MKRINIQNLPLKLQTLLSCRLSESRLKSDEYISIGTAASTSNADILIILGYINIKGKPGNVKW